MGALGDIGSVLAYGLGTGANTRADELRKQSELIRQEGLARLKHGFAIDEADYRNRQATARDETRYTRDLGIAKMRDKAAMDRNKWNFNHREPKVSDLEQKRNFFVKTYGPEKGDSMFQASLAGKGSGQFLTDAKKRIDMLAKAGLPTSRLKLQEMVIEDPDYNAYIANQKKVAKGSSLNPFDNKEPQIMPPDEWAKANKPQLYAAAAEGERIMSQIVNNEPAGALSNGMAGQPSKEVVNGEAPRKEIRSKEDLASVKKRLDGLKGMELERALQEARTVFDDKSYQLILESLGLGKKKTSILDKRGPETDLGQIAGALTHGIGKAGKWAYRNADALGKQLTASEKKALKLNNSAGRYITDRLKEAYLPGK